MFEDKIHSYIQNAYCAIKMLFKTAHTHTQTFGLKDFSCCRIFMHNFLYLAWQLPTLLLLLMSFSSFFSYPKFSWCTKSVRCKIGWSGWSSVYGDIFLLWSLTIFGLEFVNKQIKVKDHHQMATILHVHMNICSNWTRNMPHATSWWHLAPNIKHKLFQLRYIFWCFLCVLSFISLVH